MDQMNVMSRPFETTDFRDVLQFLFNLFQEKICILSVVKKNSVI